MAVGFDQQRFEQALAAVQQHLTAQLGPDFTSSLPLSLQVFDTLASTNQTLWELVGQGAIAGTAVLGLQQVAGRGQWGRTWQSPLGGLYLSVALTPQLAIADSAQLTLCSAWGIATALRSYDIPVMLKWPNDLVINGRKLGGILTETRVHHGQITKAVVGVGLNWANPVPETGVNLATVLAGKTQRSLDSLEQLAAIALQGIASGYQRWQQEGIEELLPSYVELMTGMGRSVTLSDRQGTIIGISPQGELKLRLAPTHAESSLSTEIMLKPGTISLGYDA
jgi:BirA family biotin operon repressor/biotin-[acetyl-CoA-carboxylase] ligase